MGGGQGGVSGMVAVGLLECHAILREASDEILAHKDELGRLLSCEEGKTLAERIAETARAAQIFDSSRSCGFRAKPSPRSGPNFYRPRSQLFSRRGIG